MEARSLESSRNILVEIHASNSLTQSYFQCSNTSLQNSFTAGEGTKNQSITSNLQILLTGTQREAKGNTKSKGQESAKGKKKKDKENSGKDKAKLVIF